MLLYIIEHELGKTMLEGLLGNKTKELILIFLVAREEGYAKEIADFFEAPVTPVKLQLEKLETAGILYSRNIGRARVFAFNPRYAFLKPTVSLIEKALAFYPEKTRNALLNNRRRPRKVEKPIKRELQA